MKHTHISNQEVAHMLREVGLLYEYKGVDFKPQAYERAAQTIDSLSEELSDIYLDGGIKALDALDGIGESIAGHIENIITKGTFQDYEKLKKEIPVDILELTSVEGVGVKTVKTLYEKLGIKTLDDLEEAVEENKIQTLDGFGKKSEEKIKKAIQFVRENMDRFLFTRVEDEIYKLTEVFNTIEGIYRYECAGSFRRRRETVGDIDIVMVCDDPQRVSEEISTLSILSHVYGSGDQKIHVRLRSGIDVDIIIVPEESWGSALLHFTGSKAHDIALRRRAKEKGYKLNEYGLSKAHNIVASTTEEQIYEALGLHYIEPELREDTGEIEASENNMLPRLITLSDIKGDLQMHTHWSDGIDTIEQRARYAVGLGYEYIGITDHTKALATAGGLDEKQLQEQIDEIDRVNNVLVSEGISMTVLKGAELNVARDGSLDIADNVLEMLDFAGFGIHSLFDLSEEEQTERIINAFKNPYVTIFNHPTTRLLNRRKGIIFDVEKVLEAAREYNVAMEIDAHPERRDMSYSMARKCKEIGVMIVINTDAHSNDGLHAMRYGIDEARRGWIEKGDVINTKSLKELRNFCKQ